MSSLKRRKRYVLTAPCASSSRMAAFHNISPSSSRTNSQDIAIQGLSINLADGSVYPASINLHDRVVDSIAKLWNCPADEQAEDMEHFSGAGTVGSTEACLLALLAQKFRVSFAHSIWFLDFMFASFSHNV